MISDDLLAQLPAQPPRSVDLLPGLRLSRVVAVRNLALPVVFLAFFAIVPVMILSSDPSAMLSLRETETTAALVEGTNHSHGCTGESIQVVYSFKTREGVPFRGEETVCSRTPYAEVREGQSLPIVYVKSNPAVNAIAGGRRTADPPYPVLLFPLFGLLFFVPILWPRYSQPLRDRQLFKMGPSLARGRVVFIAKDQGSLWPGWPVTTRATVYIQAQSPTGAVREVRAVCTNDWLMTHLPPGAEVTVVCHAKEPRAVLLENYLR